MSIGCRGHVGSVGKCCCRSLHGFLLSLATNGDCPYGHVASLHRSLVFTGHAQAAVTNDVYRHLGEPKMFLFCPTEYCATRAVPTVSTSEYLKTLGEQLHQNIDVMWTGPQVRRP